MQLAGREGKVLIAIYEGRIRYFESLIAERDEEIRTLNAKLLSALDPVVITTTEREDVELTPVKTLSRSPAARLARVELELRKKQKEKRDAPDVLSPNSGNVELGRK